MAIFKNAVLATLLTSVLAAPLAEKRAVVTDIVTETDYTTIDVTTTVWVSDGTEPTNAAQFPHPPAQQTGGSSPWGGSWGQGQGQGQSQSSAAPAAPATPSPATSAAAAPSVSPGGFGSQQPSAPQPQTTAMLSSAALAVSATSAASAPPMSSNPAGGSTGSTGSSSGGSIPGANSGSECIGEGAACTGDITHWDGGLGACGWNVDTNSDMQIALPVQFMGTQSNGNPYCGKSLSIKGTNGNIVQATVGDKCEGCTGFSIDLTDTLFTAVAPSGNGRVSGIEWWFN